MYLCRYQALMYLQEHTWLELLFMPSQGYSCDDGGYRRTYLRPTTWASRLWCGSLCSGVTCN